MFGRNSGGLLAKRERQESGDLHRVVVELVLEHVAAISSIADEILVMSFWGRPPVTVYRGVRVASASTT
jgi:hypothetical protein